MLPEMTVELRESETAHGLRPPTEYGSEAFKDQVSDMLLLCQAAKDPANKEEYEPWPTDALMVLHDYAPFELSPIPETMAKFGLHSWAAVGEFVMDDECIEFWTMVCKYAKAEQLEFLKDKDFIDGAGTGIYQKYLTELSRKRGDNRGTLEKAFDAKYYYKQKRPLVYLTEMLGKDARCLVNYVHPGHWSYPAGHATKFFTAVKVARETWDLEGREAKNDQEILTFAYVAGMGRCVGVHYPEDQLAGGYIAGLPEFAEYGE